MGFRKLIAELKRRNVFRVATAYAIAGWLIIQISATTFPFLNLPEWLITAVIIFVVIGFPLSLIFAWAFELTPEGLKKSQEVDITKSVTNRTGKKLNGIIITVLSMAVIFLLVERVFFAEASFIENASEIDVQTASIAVLPFVNMSGDETNEYFSDGLSEELLNGLAKLEDVQVAGRTSSFQFKGTNPDLRDVGTQLGVKHILEGSVRKSGNRLRITAQLIQADNGFHLWSETYDREFTANEIFDIQEEITRKVVQELKVRLLPKEELLISERPTQDIEAYNAFLAGTQMEITRTVSDIEKAIQKYKEAIQIDPSFAEAYARLAIAYGLEFGYGFDQSEEAIEKTKTLMKENFDHAFSIDQNLGSAYRAQGMYYSLIKELDKSENSYRKAIELLPNDPLAHNGYYLALQENKKLEESYEILEKAYHIDPINPIVARNYSNYLIGVKREFDAGLKIMDQIIDTYPAFMPIKAEKAWLIRDIPYGRPDEAFKYMFEAYTDDPSNLQFMIALGEIAGDVEFYPFMQDMINNVSNKYPDIPTATFRIQRSYLLGQGKHKEFEDYTRTLIAAIPNWTEENSVGLLAQLSFQQGKYQEALNLVERTNPELFGEMPVIDAQNIQVAKIYSALLLKTKMETRSREIAELICKFIPKNEEDLPAGIDISILYSAQIICMSLSGDFESAVKNQEKFFFDIKSKANMPFLFNLDVEYEIMEQDPAFIELKERIYSDLHSMRANIIQFLKAEGEWKEEWDNSIKN